MASAQFDIGIHGFGLAGVMLARALEREGLSFCWADEALPNAASPMAPGIINPLAGRKIKLSTDFGASHEETLATFRELEELTGQTFWHPTRLIRILESPEQAADLVQRRGETEQWIGQSFGTGAHGELVHDPFGSFETLNAGWLSVPALVEALRQRYHTAEVSVAELTLQAARRVDCRGWRCANDPRWKQLPWKNARGEVIELNLEEALPPALWNGGGWLQPLPNGNWRAGATYAWSQFEAPASLIAQSELVAKLRRWLRASYRILSQEVGVRAVLIDYRPVLGAFADEPDELIFSGLGSHGAIQAPIFSRQLAAHLAHGTPLDRDVAVARFQT